MLNNRIKQPVVVPLWTPALTEPTCRLCGARLHRTLIDLGYSPLANRTIAANAADGPLYPLHARICDNCTLVQIVDVGTPETIAAPVGYPSAPSTACLSRQKRFVAVMQKRLGLNRASLVIEVGTGSGTLLQHFLATGVSVLGIEPGSSAVPAANGTGVPITAGPFNTEFAMETAVRHGCADLVVANNVLQHTPYLFDFAAGLSCILRPNGVLILQVPHLLALLQKHQFDAFRHDSYTYLSLRVLEHVLRSVGMRAFDAEQLPDHGGSLRVHACHTVCPRAARPGLKSVRSAERAAEHESPDLYTGFTERIATAQDEIRDFLRTRQAAGRRVAAYGVATRGSTMLSCCGITTDEIACVGDPNPDRHGRLLPGSRIPIVALEDLMAEPPDDIVILPWTSAAETAMELMPLRQRGTQLWTAIPRIARV